MRAMSLKLIRGEIDEIDGVIRISWVVPRYLDGQRIGVMMGKFKEWREKTAKVMLDYQGMKKELIKPQQ